MNKNQEQLVDFMQFVADHPELRFWQAIRAFTNVPFVLVAAGQDHETGTFTGVRDTFYFEDINE